jgi:hypothetical protein
MMFGISGDQSTPNHSRSDKMLLMSPFHYTLQMGDIMFVIAKDEETVWKITQIQGAQTSFHFDEPSSSSPSNNRHNNNPIGSSVDDQGQEFVELDEGEVSITSRDNHFFQHGKVTEKFFQTLEWKELYHMLPSPKSLKESSIHR